MKLLVAGATGFIGRPLCGELLRHGHSVTAVTRNPARAVRELPRQVPAIDWSEASLKEAVGTADGIINLSGESIGAHRWTPRVKESLLVSRIDSTRKLVGAMRAAGRTDQILVNVSAVGYYGDTGDRAVTEESPPGSGFLAELCVQWEAEARRAEELGARVVLPRIGPVVAEDGGMLEKMILPFKVCLGGPLGSGRQWISWIHRADVIRMIVWLLENPAAAGPFNTVSPNPVTMRMFAKELGRALHRPAFFPVPAFLLKLILGEFAESVLTGQRAMPRAAEKLGYTWSYPTLKLGLRNIFGKEEDE